MEYRRLNGSGLFVPALTLGTGTFGGSYGFEGWGQTGVKEATHMVDMCLDAGLNMFDTADMYSRGLAEEILGKAIAGKRNRLLIATKGTFPMGESSNEKGASRFHLMEACESSLRRLGTDHIDFVHPIETWSANRKRRAAVYRNKSTVLLLVIQNLTDSCKD